VKLIVVLFCLSLALVSGVVLPMLSLYSVVCCRFHACHIFIDSIVLSVVALRSFFNEVVLVLFLAPSRTNNQPRQDLRDIGCYRAQSGGMSGEWKSSSLVTNMPENYFQQQQQHQLWLPCWSVSTVASAL
jgi:hypothetical protein